MKDRIGSFPSWRKTEAPLGLSENGVVSDRDWGQTAVRKRILKNARKVVFLFGSSKLNTLYPYTLCRIRPEDERMRLILPEKQMTGKPKL